MVRGQGWNDYPDLAVTIRKWGVIWVSARMNSPLTTPAFFFVSVIPPLRASHS
jgi:hypothetical protein